MGEKKSDKDFELLTIFKNKKSISKSQEDNFHSKACHPDDIDWCSPNACMPVKGYCVPEYDCGPCSPAFESSKEDSKEDDSRLHTPKL